MLRISKYSTNLCSHTPLSKCIFPYIDDIAFAQKVSENTVKSRLNYARRSIKEGAEKYRKQGIKLYGVAPILFLRYLISQEIESALDADTCHMMTDKVLSTISTTTPTTLGSSVTSFSAERSIATVGTVMSKTKVITAVKNASFGAKITVAVLLASVTLVGGGALLRTLFSGENSLYVPDIQSNSVVSGVVDVRPSGYTEPFAVQVSSFLLNCLDNAEWATYAKLIDFDADGIGEVLFLGDTSAHFELHDGAAWVELQNSIDKMAADTSGITVSGQIDYTIDPSGKFSILRHIDSGAIYLFHRSFKTDVIETENGYLSDEANLFVRGESSYYDAHCIFPFSYSNKQIEPVAEAQFSVYCDPRDIRAQPSQKELKIFMAQFEVIDDLIDHEDKAGIGEVRQKLEAAVQNIK